MAHNLTNIPNREVIVDGKPYLYFGGTAYLGVQDYPPFKQLFLQQMEQCGLQYGASRKSNISLDVYAKAESHLVNWVGSEACLTMSSGYLAAQLLIQTYLKQGHSLFATPNSHIALHTQGVTKVNSIASIKEKLLSEIDQGNTPVILFDTIDFEDDLFPNFDALQQLPMEEVILIGDDSHGIGVVGETGNGAYEKLKVLNPAKLMVCCSLGKALGIQAGAIFGDEEDIQVLKNTGFFGGASPASPAFMGTLLDAQDIYSERLAKLRINHATFKEHLKHPQFFNHLDGHPSFEFTNASIAKTLEAEGFLFTNFRYPDESGPLVSRIVLSAYHQKEDILKLVNCINSLV
ncbi:aminotransferase class I/II-fold pyridoxal phosphate-dependent enzyme [Flagellimonas zhangzhouensis]|uniref:7-keto-8-aminopelargonate synthetase n=1 Tax=Flagellimonas zhangzhouensis TaxID=1073328 RepID=A0A1H2RIS8_9FLAO|nr:aminotransferase class I/II-fold pyridoxal phosphate-dependent enzyme [Allomuricauda zhangzhouensis]SDQ64279.1 7-keto-8-aminopelargonate synthetase [Allomuricauda zhangzhouensis]SDW19205.1 7-keto-8-aminopelargonate synthetase [Allomuricauda zhangzhouensis]